MLDLSLLESEGWTYCTNVFSGDHVAGLKKELSTKNLSPAGIGKEKSLKSEIRSDNIYWLEEDNAEPFTLEYFAFIENLKQSLNQKFYLGLGGFEGHFAQYEKGSFYKAHRDNIKNQNSRVVTVILYLNENWKEEDGGQLRLHLDKKIDIEPQAGSVIAFMSDDMLHEVLPAHKSRQAITGWLLSH